VYLEAVVGFVDVVLEEVVYDPGMWVTAEALLAGRSSTADETH